MNFRLTALIFAVAINTITAVNVVSQPAQVAKPAVAKSANSTADDLDFASIKQAEGIIQDLDTIHGSLKRFHTDLKNPAVFSEMLKLNTTDLLKTLAAVNVTQSQDKVNANFNQLLDEFQALASNTSTKADDKAIQQLGKLQASVVALKASVAAADTNLRNPTTASIKKLDAPLQAAVDDLQKAISQNKDSEADIKKNLLPSLRTDVKALRTSLEQVTDQLKSVIAVAKANLKAQNKKANK